MTWYIYNVETRIIAEEGEDYKKMLEICDNDYDDELYALTGSPAFGTNDGLRYKDEKGAS